jgi:hypothetical protein
MSKSILIEEISRIHEMMGIKSNRLSNLLTEAVINPKLIQKSLYSDLFKQDLIDFAENTLKITKRDGSSLSFDDLVKMGREIAGDAALSEAESILKLIGRAGKTASEEISQRILTYAAANSKFYLEALVNAETDATKKAAIKTLVDDATQVADDIAYGGKTITDAVDELNTLSALVDADTTLEATTKQTIKDEIQELIDDLESTKTLRDEASAFETTNADDLISGRQIGDEAEEDWAEQFRKAQDEENTRKAYEAAKKEKVSDIIEKLKESEPYKKAYGYMTRIFEALGFGNADTFIKRAEKELSTKTLEELQNPKILNKYMDELYQKATAQLGKEGAFEMLGKIKKVFSGIDGVLRSIPFIGRFYKLFSAILGLAVLYWANDNVGVVNSTLGRTGRGIWDTFDFIPGVPEFEKTLPYCYYEIDSYVDLTTDQQLQFEGLGFNCDNADPAKADMLITKIEHVDANRAAGTKEGFKVTVGGVEKFYPVGVTTPNPPTPNPPTPNPPTPNPPTTGYTNDLPGFLKWVGDKGYTEGQKDADGYWYKDTNGAFQAARWNTNNSTWE